LLGDTSEIEGHLFNEFPTYKAHSWEELMSAGQHHPNGMQPNTKGYTIKLQPYYGLGPEEPFIVPHETWKCNGDPQAMDGDYRFVHSGVNFMQWASFRHYVGEMVVTLEAGVRIRDGNAE